MGQVTERGGLIKQNTSEPADIELYNDNIDRIHADVMSVPYSPTDPAANLTWPGKLVIRDAGDPTFFLPDTRVNKADGNWERAISGSWESYTPPTTAITVGNGTLLGRFMHIGSLLHLEILLIFGTTTAFTGNIGFGAPPGYAFRKPGDASTTLMRAGLGSWMARVAASTLHKGRVVRRETTLGLDLDCRTNDVPSVPINATVPATWTTGNKLHLHVSGEADWA